MIPENWIRRWPACSCLTIALSFAMPIHGQSSNRGELCVRIDKVGESPGSWSGILASTQWLDATVITSSNGTNRVGDKLTFGLYVVEGDKFADRQTPRLNPKVIFNGALLTLQTKDSCRFEGHIGWVYACVKSGCRKPSGPR